MDSVSIAPDLAKGNLHELFFHGLGVRKFLELPEMLAVILASWVVFLLGALGGLEGLSYWVLVIFFGWRLGVWMALLFGFECVGVFLLWRALDVL